jgi:hypothetical protein
MMLTAGAGGFAGSAGLVLAICAMPVLWRYTAMAYRRVRGRLAYGATGGKRGERLVPHTEETGALMSLLVWLAFGCLPGRVGVRGPEVADGAVCRCSA